MDQLTGLGSLSNYRNRLLRIATQPTIGFTVEQAREALEAWRTAAVPEFVPCDMPALDGDAPPSGTRTTNFYLASLASKHGMQLATLDKSIPHPSAFLIPN